MNWGELVEMELSEVRAPGQAAQIHEKLSSPSRKRNPEDSVRKHEERLAKAQQKRQRQNEEGVERLRVLHRRVDEVRKKRKDIEAIKRMFLEDRMARAAENRQQQLQAIVKKAKDEDEKVLEIAFINNLEHDGKRHEFICRNQDLEQRLKSIQDERQRKADDAAAREAAVQERRRAAEELRQAKLRELADKTRRRQEQIEQYKQEQKQEQQQAARDKAKEREDRIAEIKAAKQATADSRVQKMKLKHEESVRRYGENIELIKQRAIEMSSPKTPLPPTAAIPAVITTIDDDGCSDMMVTSTHSAPAEVITSNSSSAAALVSSARSVTPVANSAIVLSAAATTTVTSASNALPSSAPFERNKICTICSVLLPSELHMVAHLKGKKHNSGTMQSSDPNKGVKEESAESQENDTQQSDKNKNLNKKKRRQKLRQKLQQRSREFEVHGCKNKSDSKTIPSAQKSKLERLVRDLKNRIDSNGMDRYWLPADIHQLERNLGEISRAVATIKEQDLLWELSLPDILLNLLSLLEKDEKCLLPVPSRCFISCTDLLKTLIQKNPAACCNLLCTMRAPLVIDVLASLLKTKISSPRLSAHGGALKADALDTLCMGQLALLHSTLVGLNEIIIAGDLHNCLATDLDNLRGRILLIASYLVTCGCVDSFSCALRQWSGRAKDVSPLSDKLLLPFVNFLVTLLHYFVNDNKSFVKSKVSLESGGILLTATAEQILPELLLYLYDKLTKNVACAVAGRQSPPQLNAETVQQCECILDLLNVCAALDHSLIQEMLGEDCMSFVFRYIVTFLMNYCGKNGQSRLLHRAIVAVGHFVLQNSDNQMLIQTGAQPNTLQQLCIMPFSYFSDSALKHILFPTLIAASFQHTNNRELLEKELSGILLAVYIQDCLDNDNAETKERWPVDLNDFRLRFPRDIWQEAKNYFETPMLKLPHIEENNM